MSVPTLQASFSQLTVINTEHNVIDIQIAGTFVFEIDLTPMANLDVVEVRVYKVMATGDAKQVCFFDRFTDAQATDDRYKILDRVFGNDLTDNPSLRMTVKQTAGSVRTLKGKALKF